jgi:dihydroflavonol-4-reductase
MKALVTGGAGFVGRHLVAALKAKGVEVRALDLQKADDCETVIGSVDDAEIARRAAEGCDHVFHLAGVAHLWSRDPGVFERVNHQGTRVMLGATARAGVRRFIHCSSLTTLVGRSTPIGESAADESARFEPDDMLGAYPRSKLLAERAVEAATREGVDALIAMPTEPMGAGDMALTPPTQMALDLLNRKTPATIAMTLNIVPVRDLAQGFIAAAEKGRRGERYLLGGENCSMRDILAMLERASGVAMPKAELPYAVALAAGLVDDGVIARLSGRAPKAPLTGVRLAGRRVAFSSEKAARELLWRAGPAEGAIAELVQWASATGLWRK